MNLKKILIILIAVVFIMLAVVYFSEVKKTTAQTPVQKKTMQTKKTLLQKKPRNIHSINEMKKVMDDAKAVEGILKKHQQEQLEQLKNN